jgi:hypothetical protein
VIGLTKRMKRLEQKLRITSSSTNSTGGYENEPHCSRDILTTLGHAVETIMNTQRQQESTAVASRAHRSLSHPQSATAAVATAGGKAAASLNAKIEGRSAVHSEPLRSTSNKPEGQSLSLGRREEWACSSCTLLNPHAVWRCSLCGGDRVQVGGQHAHRETPAAELVSQTDGVLPSHSSALVISLDDDDDFEDSGDCGQVAVGVSSRKRRSSDTPTPTPPSSLRDEAAADDDADDGSRRNISSCLGEPSGASNKKPRRRSLKLPSPTNSSGRRSKVEERGTTEEGGDAAADAMIGENTLCDAGSRDGNPGDIDGKSVLDEQEMHTEQDQQLLTTGASASADIDMELERSAHDPAFVSIPATLPSTGTSVVEDSPTSLSDMEIDLLFNLQEDSFLYSPPTVVVVGRRLGDLRAGKNLLVGAYHIVIYHIVIILPRQMIAYIYVYTQV